MELGIDNKNQLQEYYQKLHLDVPSYSTEAYGGKSNAPFWRSTVTLYDKSIFVGNVQKTKINAEKSAAFIALSTLLLKPIKSIIEHQYINKTVMLIDVENMPKFFNEIPIHDLNNPNLTVYGFIGMHHSLVDKMNHPKMIKIISPSTRADGTDTCMQVYVGMLLTRALYDHYIIVTRDHFGYALVEMITTSSLDWTSKSAKVITKYDQL